MTNSGFTINGVEFTANWPDKSYLIDRYPELADTLKQAGLWACGSNSFGELGNNNITTQSSPVQTISGGSNWKEISCGRYYNAAIKTDGTLWLWGLNNLAQLGDNTVVSKSSPVQILGGGTNWKQVATGESHGAGIKVGGTLWMWGSNSSGQLGTNDRTNRSSPVQTISGGTNWKLVSCGVSNTVAIKTDGTLWVWGLGFLGDGSGGNKSSPVQTLSGGTNWKTATCGSYRFAGIKTDGTLWIWGTNNYGQLGTNNTTSYDSPVQTVSGGTNWKDISCSGSSTFAIKTDGTLWGWGNNYRGSLGDGTTTSKSSPVQTIAGGTNWKILAKCSSGAYGGAALKTDGSLWLWGSNISGQLGTNDSTSRSSPVQTIAGGNAWRAVSLGESHFMTIRDMSSDPL